MIERTWLYFPDVLVDDDVASSIEATYPRVVTSGALICNGIIPTAACKIKLTLDDVAQAAEYTLPLGQKYAAFNVSGTGLAVAAGVVLGAIITANGGATKLRVDLELASTTANDTETGWIILTAAMLQSRISAPEYNALTAAAIASGQSDPIPQILSDVTERIRAAIRSGGRCALGPVATVPASLRRDGLAIAKHDLFARISALRTIAETAKADAEKAERHLDRVEEGKITPETPTTSTESPTSGVAHSAPTRTTTRDNLNGL